MEASSIEISAETPLGKPWRSKNRHGLINNKATRHANASGFSISCPKYTSAKIIIRHKSGLTSFAKTIEVEEDRQIPMG
jgi:hypothetical protein